MNKYIKFGVVILLFGFNILAQKKINDKPVIDAAVKKAAEAYMTKSRAVGMSVGIYMNGKFYIYNYGLADKEKGKAPAADSLYEIASITKTFTGTLLAQAAIEKKVNLEDDIRKYMDGDYPNLEFEGQPIRLFHLLNHRSGLPNFLPDTPGTVPGTDKRAEWTPARIAEVWKDYSRADFYRDLHKVKLEAVPGKYVSYSNSAGQLMGYILERVYGMSYEDLVKAKITGPLKMPDTAITLTASQKKRLVTGYDAQGTVMPYSPEKFQAAGALKSTVADLLKYARWHSAEKDEAVKVTHQPTWSATDINYSAGLNWQMLKSADGSSRLIWQSGNLGGFSSMCAVYPELDMGIVILTNLQRGNLSGLTTQISQAIDSRAVAFP